MNYWNVDLTSDELVMNVTMTRVPAKTSELAEYTAKALMAQPEVWRVTGIDRA
ncbi:hypothetical protein [Burkholderia phage BCSR52]|uniref:Uncharacterized protein n=1 Tax=Burkholderia phage BCSR52 TaxID=2805748 RepID=A0A889IPY3_9CAUD|nr:hypothetical protein [Burkholderia phage BCSR52]